MSSFCRCFCRQARPLFLLPKHPGKAVHHTRTFLQMFSFLHFHCAEVALENRNWWSTLTNILLCPAPPKCLSHLLHHTGCECSPFSPEVTTCVIMCHQVTYYISRRLLILVSFTKRQLWKKQSLNCYLWTAWLCWSCQLNTRWWQIRCSLSFC